MKGLETDAMGSNLSVVNGRFDSISEYPKASRKMVSPLWRTIKEPPRDLLLLHGLPHNVGQRIDLILRHAMRLQVSCNRHLLLLPESGKAYSQIR